MSLDNQPPLSLWRRLLGARPEATVLRGLFASLVVLTVTVLGYDLLTRLGEPSPAMDWLPGETSKVQPYLPSVRPDIAAPDESRPGTPKAELSRPMVIELVSGGRIEATGAITPGTGERFKSEYGSVEVIAD